MGFSDSLDQTWQFDSNEANVALKGSDFKLQIMELPDSLLTYRAQNKQPNAGQGIFYRQRKAFHRMASKRGSGSHAKQQN